MQSKYDDSDPLYAIERGYDESTRMLMFHSTPLKADKLQEALDIIKQYNEFDSKRVGKVLLAEYPDAEFVVGREYSVVVYVQPKEQQLLQDEQHIKDVGNRMVADEAWSTDYDGIRFWFD